MEAVFRNAVQHESIFVFIDEVDNVCESATATIVHTSNLKSTLLTELTRVAAERLRIFIGATNYPEKIDENFLRRFHQRIWIRPPNQKKKGDILTLYLRKCHYNLSEGAIALLSNFRELEDCSGDDIRVMVETAATLPLKELVQNDHASWKRVRESRRIPPKRRQLLTRVAIIGLKDRYPDIGYPSTTWTPPNQTLSSSEQESSRRMKRKWSEAWRPQRTWSAGLYWAIKQRRAAEERGGEASTDLGGNCFRGYMG